MFVFRRSSDGLGNAPITIRSPLTFVVLASSLTVPPVGPPAGCRNRTASPVSPIWDQEIAEVRDTIDSQRSLDGCKVARFLCEIHRYVAVSDSELTCRGQDRLRDRANILPAKAEVRSLVGFHKAASRPSDPSYQN